VKGFVIRIVKEYLIIFDFAQLYKPIIQSRTLPIISKNP